MTTITVTFDPPLPSDSPATFNSKAFDTLGDLNTWSGQANTVAGEVNTNAANAAASAVASASSASTSTTKAGEANASAVAAAASASSASTSAGTATTKASEADASAIAAAASAASIAPGSLLTTANPSYTGTLTGGTGVVNLGSGQLVKDTSGNFGLGVTPSAGGDVYYRRIELGKAGCGIAAATSSLTSSVPSYFTGNAVITYTGANPWKYGNDGAAGYYAIEDGQHKWGVAPSGTAGNPITFTTAMTLDASGALRVQEVGNSNGTMQLGGTTYYGTIKHDASSTGANIYNVASASGGGHIFQRGGTTQFMTDGSDNLLVGTTSAVLSSKLLSSFSGATNNGLVLNETANTSGTTYVAFANGGTIIGSVVRVGATAAVNYATTSDRRLKNNIRLADAKRFMDVEFVDFEWDGGQHDCGVIADQLASVYPDLVFGEKDATEEVEYEVSPAVPAVLDEDGNEVTPAVEAVMGTKTQPKYQQVNYMGLIARMGTVVQRHEKTIEAMQTQLDAQNTAMQMLATRLAALEAAAT